jgi:hypothetical protein
MEVQLSSVAIRNAVLIVRALLGSCAGRGGRVAEGARLESVYTGNCIVGSNPTPSANFNVKSNT